MKGITKTLIVVGLTKLMAVTIYLVSSFGTSFVASRHAADGATCNHSGNHYLEKAPTYTAGGVKEYWVCCDCHQFFIELPSIGKWNDAGVATISVSENDARYICPGNAPDKQGLVYSEDGTSIVSYVPVPGVTDIVIPDGITSFGTVFAGSNITSIVVAGSVEKISGAAFKDCEQLKSAVIMEGVARLVYTGSHEGPFTECSALEWIVIPKSVTELQYYIAKDARKKGEITIYCEIDSFPGTKKIDGVKYNWDTLWAMNGNGGKYNIVWGLNKNWHYAADGITPVEY